MSLRVNILCLVITLLTCTARRAAAANPPAVGEIAPNFTLSTLDDRLVELKQLNAKSPVVLVMLRGWPGYQCPLCTRQVNDFVTHAAEFTTAGAKVVMVYPGPIQNLQAHAQEFIQNKNWPKEFVFLTDPDFVFTTAYGLRWEAKGETAYPSTFILDNAGKVRFAHVSKQHGDRVSSAAVLKLLKEGK